MAPDQRQSSKLAGFNLVLPLLAPTFRGGQSRAFRGEPIGIGAASPTGGNLPKVSNISEPYLGEVVCATFGWLPFAISSAKPTRLRSM